MTLAWVSWELERIRDRPDPELWPDVERQHFMLRKNPFGWVEVIHPN